jgi:hypothetical protein
VLLLGDHCTSPQFKFKTYNCSSIYQHYQPLYLPNIIFLALCFELFLNLRGKIEKILYRRCAPRALKNACDKMVSYKTRIITITKHNTRKLDCLIFEVYAIFLHSSVSPIEMNFSQCHFKFSWYCHKLKSFPCLNMPSINKISIIH